LLLTYYYVTSLLHTHTVVHCTYFTIYPDSRVVSKQFTFRCKLILLTIFAFSSYGWWRLIIIITYYYLHTPLFDDAVKSEVIIMIWVRYTSLVGELNPLYILSYFLLSFISSWLKCCSWVPLLLIRCKTM
jgi:hypothetical protein